MGLLFLLCTCLLATAAFATIPSKEVTILRDTYGTPHIFANSETDAAFGFGYAQAEDRLEAILQHYKEARGEKAEITGQAALEQDMPVRAFRLAETAREKYDKLPKEVRAEVEAFVAGINRYQKDHPEKRPTWAFDVTPQDVVTFALFVNLSFARDPFEKGVPMGSNAFAVASKRTASGKGSLVLLNPHLPLSGWLRWYEGHVSSPGNDIAGVTFAGLPYIVMGHNGKVAWANTVNDPDLSDWYEIRLVLTNGKPTAYEYDGSKRPLTFQNYTFRYKKPDGTLGEMTQTIPYTHHGPILLQSNGKAYAIRKAGVGDMGVLIQSRAQGHARNIEEYRKAIALRHVVMFNHIFGDADGHIGYIYGGQVPQRPDGYDFRSPVPGWTKATEWGESVPFEKLPQAVNPVDGVLQSCNDNPTAVGAGDALKPYNTADKYPFWLAPSIYTLRGQHMLRLLQATKTFTPEQAIALATDVTDLNALRELPTLLKAVQANKDAEILKEAVAVLTAWDKTLKQNSKGAALWQTWLMQPDIAARLNVGGFADLKAVPVAVTEPAKAVNALKDAVEYMKMHGLPLDLEWGAVNRLKRGSIDLPCDGGADSLTPNVGRLGADGRVTVQFGPSYSMLVELGNGEPRAWSILPFGNSDDPASPHYTDQMPLTSKRKYRPFPYKRADVEKEATSRLTLKSLP